MTRHERDERGVTAILVGVLAIFLVGIAAFTVDAGAAFVSNRNLQRAADAGALAGAQTLTEYTGTCNNVASNTTATTAAHARAVAIARENYPDASWGETEFTVRCDPELRVLLVEFGNQGTTEAVFAPIFD